MNLNSTHSDYNAHTASVTHEYLDQEAREVLTDLMDGDAEMIIDLVDTLIDTTPELLEELVLGVNNGDASQVRNSAHALKSSNAQLGALSFAELCQEMENKGKSEDLAEADQLLNQIKQEYEKVTSALESWKTVLQA